ncbi:hypothetical protein IJ076_00125 [Candidatus Saccharibacteria bacterium]|nr:hypothetical protein [Candidatus Saccharibacteria bacterium]
MESQLVDPAILGQFVDALISEKYPDQPETNFANLREKAIKALDFQILKSILGSLTKEQGAELNQLLDNPSSDETTFENFFKDYGINLEAVLKDTMVKFKDDFMKGAQNA